MGGGESGRGAARNAPLTRALTSRLQAPNHAHQNKPSAEKAQIQQRPICKSIFHLPYLSIEHLSINYTLWIQLLSTLSMYLFPFNLLTTIYQSTW